MLNGVTSRSSKWEHESRVPVIVPNLPAYCLLVWAHRYSNAPGSVPPHEHIRQQRGLLQAQNAACRSVAHEATDQQETPCICSHLSLATTSANFNH